MDHFNPDSFWSPAEATTTATNATSPSTPAPEGRRLLGHGNGEADPGLGVDELAHHFPSSGFWTDQSTINTMYRDSAPINSVFF
jgi:hypothetical protein